jgi:Heavy metal associated domain 2
MVTDGEQLPRSADGAASRHAEGDPAAGGSLGGGPAAARLVSSTPGRLRVRLAGGDGRQAALRRVRDGLSGRPGVRAVETSAVTGSVLVHYDPARTTAEDVADLLEDLGLLVVEVGNGGAPVGHIPDVPSETGHSRPAAGLIATLGDADRRLSRLTGGALDLKLLFPLALGAVGAGQLVRQGLGLSQIPAYVLLWYAFDSFFKFHQQPGRDLPDEPSEAEG